jgi:GT2 family glycosyltransferase
MEKINFNDAVDISVSIVSHLQMNLIVDLLRDIQNHCGNSSLEVILTLNLDEDFTFALSDFSYPLKIIRNVAPMGFGANHNQAFAYANGKYFCVLNPDIRLNLNPFYKLVPFLEDSSVGIVAPLVLSATGGVEDSARYFPNPVKILCKIFGGCRGPDYVIKDAPIYPEWVGGMFMLFSRSHFKKVAGFDQRYFLYYEDVDICGRLRLLGYKVVLDPGTKVVHHAQRSSHRNLRYLRWHLISMMRFFLSSVYWRLQLVARV